MFKREGRMIIKHKKANSRMYRIGFYFEVELFLVVLFWCDCII